MWHSVEHFDNTTSFWLPGHKSNQFFEGNKLFIHRSSAKTYALFESYLNSRDRLFRARPELWLHANGTIPTHSWFIQWLHSFFPNSFGGQSMCAGGATELAEAGTLPAIIQAGGRWSSDTFNRYIRKNPFLFEALLTRRSPHIISVNQ
jgi:hypothetical protein